jgi:hypothetical protein
MDNLKSKKGTFAARDCPTPGCCAARRTVATSDELK